MHRVRESFGLADNAINKGVVQKQLDLMIAEIDNDIFEFAKRFPKSSKSGFFTELEGRRLTKKLEKIMFGDYAKTWFEAMKSGMSRSQTRDYEGCLRRHIVPFFGNTPFSELTSVHVKKFVAQMKSKTNPHGKLLSAKRIRNVMIPLRVITNDAFAEYGWLVHPARSISQGKTTKTSKVSSAAVQF